MTFPAELSTPYSVIQGQILGLNRSACFKKSSTENSAEDDPETAEMCSHASVLTFTTY